MGEHELNEELEKTRKRKDYLLKLIADDSEFKEIKELLSSSDKLVTFFLPSFMKWTEKREKQGKDVSFLEFVKEEDISNLELGIIIKNIDNYPGKEKPENFSRGAEIKKMEICNSIREQSHMILAEIGTLEPNIRNLKNKKLEKDFLDWSERNIERLQIISTLTFAGATAFLHGFVKYWDGQGKIDKSMAKINKNKIGEAEHAFMLKTISKMVENVVVLIEKSENIEEASFYNGEIKKFLATMVEWNNEYQRLYKVGNKNVLPNQAIAGAYGEISKKVEEMERLLINEKYSQKPEKKKRENISNAENGEKRNICSKKLEEVKKESDSVIKRIERVPEGKYKELKGKVMAGNRILLKPNEEALIDYFENQKPEDEKRKIALQELIDMLVKIDKSTDIKEITELVSDCKHNIYSNRLSV